MSLVFWDTNLFIYVLEENPAFFSRVRGIWNRIVERDDRLCTSALTVGETLVAPVKTRDARLEAAYRGLFSSEEILVLEFGEAAAAHYAEIRASTRVSRADAMQLACAAANDVDLFITNDRALSTVGVRGVQFIATLENCPL